MKFIFKMLVLVGLILVGKFLKEDNTNEIVRGQSKSTQEIYTLKSNPSVPVIQSGNKLVEPAIKQVNTTDKTFTVRLN